ncbi:MAG: ORF6C domain protein [Bacteriophage sp.]|nr:MAG: ORF6C domain protein [Bacteriophage sp.]
MNELKITEYKGIRVLTTQQIAKAYETDRKVISYNFNHNKERYAEGKHYICLTDDELKAFREIHDLPTNLNKLYLWTEKGAFLHAKSLNTDKAWDVYDRLVDTYFEKPQAKQLSPVEMMRIQLGMIDDHENRINNLENTMTIDYAQQESIRDLVSSVVIAHLGGKESNAYKEIGKKVFAECNRDIKTYFAVNARNNIPKLKFEEAMEYVKNWHPCTNTVMCIRDCNAQMCIE